MQITQDFVARFWRKVDRKGGDSCWPWLGAKSTSGYGVVSINGKHKGAHRVCYAIENGADKLTPEMHVCHSCDNRICVNPSHLSLGTALDNMAQREARGRGNRPQGERVYGAKLTDGIVKDIRSEPITLERTCDLMMKYRIKEATILSVYNRKSWKHIL